MFIDHTYPIEISHEQIDKAEERDHDGKQRYRSNNPFNLDQEVLVVQNDKHRADRRVRVHHKKLHRPVWRSGIHNIHMWA